MLNLRPQRSFTVVRQIENHLDSDTNYVQAVIRNAYTDAIIATLQLTSRGSQRFSKNWQVPADPSGMGFFISIVTSVYTDSGYTTKNPNYGDQENTYLVKDDTLNYGGGSSGPDNATIRRIMAEELDKRDKKKEPEAPAPEFIKMDPEQVRMLMLAIENVPGDTQEKAPVDFTPVLTAIGAVRDAILEKIAELDIPENDIVPVVNLLTALETTVTDCHEEYMGEMQKIAPAVAKEVAGAVTDAVENSKFTLVTPIAVKAVEETATESEPNADISKLTS